MLAPLLLAALVQVPAPTQELAPGTMYDPAIPTLQEVVGHDFREDVTPPADVVRYFEALAEAAPDRTHLLQYAESWQGRPLIALVIASPDRISRLDEISEQLNRFSDCLLYTSDAADE